MHQVLPFVIKHPATFWLAPSEELNWIGEQNFGRKRKK